MGPGFPFRHCAVGPGSAQSGRPDGRRCRLVEVAPVVPMGTEHLRFPFLGIAGLSEELKQVKGPAADCRRWGAGARSRL